MISTERGKAPDLESINKLNIVEPVIYRLDNSIPVYAVNMNDSEVIQLAV